MVTYCRLLYRFIFGRIHSSSIVPNYATFIVYLPGQADNASVPTAVIAPNTPPPVSATAKTRRARSELPALASIASRFGTPLWPWQADTARVALERRPDGRWRYPIVTVCVPRQSGKTTLTGLLAFHRCIEQPDCRVWYTAQSRQDAMGRFRDFVRLLRRSDLVELNSGVRNTGDYAWDYRVRLGVGAECIEFGNGSMFQIFSPAEDSLHGSVTDLVIFDEARFFDEAAGRGLMAAALPTMATRDGQLWIISTGGGPESTFLAGELERSRAELGSADTRRAHFEYGIGYDVADFELLDRVWQAHPAAGQPGGPNLDALTVAAGAMPPQQFAHEYGNRWRSSDDARLIPRDRWDAGLWQAMPAGEPFLGVDVAIDRNSAAVVACIGSVLQVLDYRPGVTWLADRVFDIAAAHNPPAIWLDPAGPAGAVALELAARLPGMVHMATGREVSAACGAFEDAAASDPPLLGHVMSEALDESVSFAAHRRIGQAWQWSRVDSGPVLFASTLAHAAYRAALANPVAEPMVW